MGMYECLSLYYVVNDIRICYMAFFGECYVMLLLKGCRLLN